MGKKIPNQAPRKHLSTRAKIKDKGNEVAFVVDFHTAAADYKRAIKGRALHQLFPNYDGIRESFRLENPVPPALSRPPLSHVPKVPHPQGCSTPPGMSIAQLPGSTCARAGQHFVQEFLQEKPNWLGVNLGPKEGGKRPRNTKI